MERTLSISAIILIIASILSATSCTNNKVSENHLAMNTAKPAPTTLINSFEVPSDRLEESIKYWETCRDFLMNEPGYISTKLHRSIKNDARFQLVNVATWETPEAFMNASKKMASELGVSPVEGLKANPALYTVIRE